MSRWHRAAAVVLAAASLVALGGCAARAALPVGEKIGEHFIHDHMKTVVDANFEHLVGGDWTRATIVCGPASGAAIDRALGFDAVAATSLQPANQSMMLFSNASRILHRVVVSRDAAHSDQQFSPCFTPSAPNPGHGTLVTQVVVVPRADARIPLRNDETDLPWPLWYITGTERAKLQAEFGS
jgi:hypothetical protein